MSEDKLNIANSVILNSDYYINKNISEIVMNYINTMDYNKVKTIKSVVVGVGIIIVADITKSVILDFLKEQKKQINEGLTEIIKDVPIFSTLMWTIKFPFTSLNFSYNFILHKYNNIFFKKVKKPEIIDNSVIFEVEPTQIFISNLIKYIETNIETCEYCKKYDNKIMIEKNNINNNIKYNNININFEDINITINENITKSRDKYEIEQISNNKIFENIMEKYLSMNVIVDDNIQVIINSIGHDYFSIIISKYIYYFYKDISSINSTITINCIFTLCLKKYEKETNFIFNDYGHNNLTVKQKNMFLLSAAITKEFCVFHKEKINIIKKLYDHEHIKINTNNNYNFNPDDFHYGKCGNCIRFDKYNLDNKTYLDFSFLPKNYFDNLKIVNTDEQSTQDEGLEFNVKLLNNEKDKNNYINEQVKKFISHINNLSLNSTNNKKIKIYILQIEKKNLTKNTTNPKYEKYLNQKKELLDENKDLKKKEIINLLGVEPEQELSEEYINKEIKMDLINEKHTSFDNLYLSKEQDIELYQLYNSFEKDKKENEELGIPNKLCILLHGEPGTGKTTTIVATASYF